MNTGRLAYRAEVSITSKTNLPEELKFEAPKVRIFIEPPYANGFLKKF